MEHSIQSFKEDDVRDTLDNFFKGESVIYIFAKRCNGSSKFYLLVQAKGYKSIQVINKNGEKRKLKMKGLERIVFLNQLDVVERIEEMKEALEKVENISSKAKEILEDTELIVGEALFLV